MSAQVALSSCLIAVSVAFCASTAADAEKVRRRAWTRQGPQLANAQRDPGCPADEGVCQFSAPVVAMLETGPSGIFPRTHAERWCGQWHLKGGAGGPDDGERVVVPLRKVA